METRRSNFCLVCGDIAVGVNFGVITCAPCKAFFRRNAIKLGKVEFVCQEDGDCPVTYESRRICGCCRLAKCFRVGMKRSLILTDSEREARKALVQMNRLKRLQDPNILDFETIPMDIDFFPNDRQSNFISMSHRQVLQNIFNAYATTCAPVAKVRNENLLLIEHKSIHTFFNDFSDRHRSLIEYFKKVPEFSRLSMDDKIRLLRNHFGTMLNINESIICGCLSNNITNSLRNVFGKNLGERVIKSIEKLNFYGTDPILLKLILIVRTFSSGINRFRKDFNTDRLFDDTHIIFRNQNVYVDLLWRYISGRSCSDADTVKFLNKLVLDLLYLQGVCYEAGSYVYQNENEIDQMEPVIKSMWPRTTTVP